MKDKTEFTAKLSFPEHLARELINERLLMVAMQNNVVILLNCAEGEHSSGRVIELRGKRLAVEAIIAGVQNLKPKLVE
jgi:hypothetical protein